MKSTQEVTNLLHATLVVLKILCLVILCSLWILPDAALAQLGEHTALMPTDTMVPPVVMTHPGVMPPKSRANGHEAGLLMTRDERTSKLDHTTVGGDDIKSVVSDEAVLGAVHFDLGAGARVALLHELVFRKTKTTSSAIRRGVPREEVERIQMDALKITIELTEGLTAGMILRYVYRDRLIYGDLSVAQQNRYKISMIGYGGGAALTLKNFGLGYAYYPQLRGKTDVLGEEKIVVEPGFLNIDVSYKPSDSLAFSLLNRRFLWELDDIGRGTTNTDTNQTRISLYGLDPDQYLLTDTLTMLGVSYELGKIATLKVALGQEKAHFNFQDLLVYNRVDVRQRTGDPRDLTYNRARAQISWLLNKGLDISLGMGLYERKFEFPTAMNGGTYEASGRELIAAAGISF